MIKYSDYVVIPGSSESNINKLTVSGVVQNQEINLEANTVIDVLTTITYDDIDSDTLFLVRSNGVNSSTTFLEVSDYNRPITIVGTVTNDNTQSVFGDTSIMCCDNTLGELNIASHTDMAVGTGDFTVDYQYYQLATNSQTPYPFDVMGRITVWHPNHDSFVVGIGSQRYVINIDITLSVGWHHLAVVRHNGSLSLYIDGTVRSTVNNADSQASITYSTSPVRLARWRYNNPAKYMDEIRFSKVARWTENFTPPTARYEQDQVTQAEPLRYNTDYSTLIANETSHKITYLGAQTKDLVVVYSS